MPWQMPSEVSSMNLRHVRIFKNGRNQAIRIPRELELSATEATIHREGNRLVIEPVERISLLDVVANWEPLDIDFPELADEKPAAVEL
jgi:antitoxin VapB